MTDVHCPQFLLIPRLLNPRQSGLSPSSHRNSPQVPPSEMPSTVLSSHPTWPSGGTGATGPSSSETPPLLAPGLARHALSCCSSASQGLCLSPCSSLRISSASAQGSVLGSPLVFAFSPLQMPSVFSRLYLHPTPLPQTVDWV